MNNSPSPKRVAKVATYWLQCCYTLATVGIDGDQVMCSALGAAGEKFTKLQKPGFSIRRSAVLAAIVASFVM